MFSRKTISFHLWFLTIGFSVTLALVGAVGIYELNHEKEMLNSIAGNALPAVRNMTLVDMMHDGLRASVYSSLALDSDATAEERNAIRTDLEELSSNISIYLTNVDKLELSETVKQAMPANKSAVNIYVASAKEVVELALSGDKEAARNSLAKFNEHFEQLEEMLGKLGETVENEAHTLAEDSKKATDFNILVLSIMSIGGIAIGFLVSILSIRSIMKSLKSVVENLRNSAASVSESATESESTAIYLSESATQQASSLQETMASAEQISAMVNQNAESADQARRTVENNDKATTEGATAVTKMVKAINEIKNTNDSILGRMEQSNRQFGEIVQIIAEIGNKTKVINDIVFQTKLLSFNASVEAARAGEHGKGFAVVAEEVGSLAQMSGNAAKEITDMLTASIRRVESIVDETQKSVEHLVEVAKDKIAVGQETADQCQAALTILSDNSKSLTSMVSEIAHASKEQSQGIREINTAIAQLDQVTQRNASVAQQSSHQAETLNTQTHALEQSLSVLIRFTGMQAEDTTPPKEARLSVQKTSDIRVKHAPVSAATLDAAPVLRIKPRGEAQGKNSGPKPQPSTTDRTTPSASAAGFEDF